MQFICGTFLPDELYAELLHIFSTDNFIFKNSKYFWNSYCRPTLSYFSLSL